MFREGGVQAIIWGRFWEDAVDCGEGNFRGGDVGLQLASVVGIRGVLRDGKAGKWWRRGTDVLGEFGG